jgi:tetratricopeptide (TPR) repeat protein
VRLGRFDEARRLLDELFKTTAELKGSYLQVVPELELIKAELAFSEGNVGQATTSASEAVKTAPARSDVLTESKFFLGLVKAASGAKREAKQLCDEAIDIASNSGNSRLYSVAQLRCAEAALKGNDAQTALTLATQAQSSFARSGQRESEWRAWAVLSLAYQQLGEQTKVQETSKTAESLRSQLEQDWGSSVFKQYATRPDIQVYSH